MVRFSDLFLLVLFCAGCGNKAVPERQANLGSQTQQGANTSAKSSPQRQQTAAQPQYEARAVLVPVPAEKPKEPIPHQIVVTIPGAKRISFAVPSPKAEEVFVLAQMSSDNYSGTFFVVRLDGGVNQTDAVMEGTNLTYPDPPTWSPDGQTAYMAFDNGSFLPADNQSGHGLFTWDRNSGKVTQILGDSIDGLTLSPDGMLAAFWDYSTGDKLTVFNVKTRQVVRTWFGLIHSEDDLVLTELAFTPDGKSLLARLYAPVEDAVMQYEIASGKISPFAEDVQAMVAVGDGVYLLQFKPVPFTNPENPHRLTKWAPGLPALITLEEDFHYFGLTGRNGSPWLVAGSALGYNSGIGLYDMRTGQIQKAGSGCDTAIVTSSGKILYVFGNELIADSSVCNGPSPLNSNP